MGLTKQPQPMPRARMLGMVVACAFVMWPALHYWEKGPESFGEHPLQKLFAFAAVGGALGAAIHCGRKYWFVGLVPGAVAGIGSSWLHLYYTQVFHKETMLRSETILTLLVGAVPGVVLLQLLLLWRKVCDEAKVRELMQSQPPQQSAGEEEKAA